MDTLLKKLFHLIFVYWLARWYGFILVMVMFWLFYEVAFSMVSGNEICHFDFTDLVWKGDC